MATKSLQDILGIQAALALGSAYAEREGSDEDAETIRRAMISLERLAMVYCDTTIEGKS